ncbi:MAG: hypothetical protein DI570_23475 [Phenylobacterium zucineum]|nr:MAG: hypothetical protein DI570_23475 [Phenylobacterium zucineum]
MKPDISLGDVSGLGVSRAQLDALLNAHEQVTDNLLLSGAPMAAATGEAANVLGVGVTTRPDGEGAALLILVDRLPDAVAATTPAPAGDVPVVYQEVGDIVAANYRNRNRPVNCGVSIAPCGLGYSGTLGCLVESNDVRYMLSNNHVLADANRAAVGTRISQQSGQDGGACPADEIGALAAFVNLNFGGTSPVDAAIATISSEVTVRPLILRDHGVVQQLALPVQTPSLQMNVQKSGRTTGHTHGQVNAIGVTISVSYGAQRSTFSNAFTSVAGSGDFGLPGDSGSLITTDPRNEPTGLLFAVDAGRKFTYGNRMSDVLSELAKLTGHPVTVVI